MKTLVKELGKTVFWSIYGTLAGIGALVVICDIASHFTKKN